VETVDCKKASRFLVREIFSSASDAFSRTPRTISSGAFSTNYMKEKRYMTEHEKMDFQQTSKRSYGLNITMTKWLKSYG
jgi:hypothetical protein